MKVVSTINDRVGEVAGRESVCTGAITLPHCLHTFQLQEELGVCFKKISGTFRTRSFGREHANSPIQFLTDKAITNKIMNECEDA